MVRDNCPCGICHKNILDHHKAVFCNNCKLWVHIRCNNTSNSEYNELQKEADDVPWFCLNCTIIILPFGQLDNDELSNLHDFDFPSFVDSMPSFEITSSLTNLPNLGDYDIDEHLPSNVNSSYYTLQDLSTLSTSDNDFSLFHMNTRSLSLHFDELISTIATLKINFDVIGLSETWNSIQNPIKTNVEIPGYKYFPCGSQSQNGGLALYVKTGLTPTPRPDLSKIIPILNQFGLKLRTTMVKIVCCVVPIVILTQLLILFVTICKKFCPIQLYLINKFLSLVILILTF